MTEERIIAYLLEELPEDESGRFEEECFAQESWPSRLNLVEEDLIDDYLRHELSPEQRRRFEQNYLTTAARRERVLVAAALLRHLGDCQDDTPVEVVPELTRRTWVERFRAFWGGQGWPLRALVPVGLVCVIAASLWFALPRSTTTPRVFTLALTASASNRAEGSQPVAVKIPGDVDRLKISLMLPERTPPAARYRVEVDNDRGETVPLEVDAQDDRSVSVVLPANRLARGQYALNLFAVKPDGAEQPVGGGYFFNVE